MEREIEKEVGQLAEELARELGLVLVDVDWNGRELVVTVDAPGGGVRMRELVAMNQELSRRLDLLDPIPGPYTLQVSSPGLTRPLRKPRELAWAVGKRVKVTFADGRVLRGTLEAYDGQRIKVAGQEAALEGAKIQLDEV